MMMKKKNNLPNRSQPHLLYLQRRFKVPHTTARVRNHGYIASTAIGEKSTARLLFGMDTHERKYHVPCTNGEDGEDGGDGEESLHRKR